MNGTWEHCVIQFDVKGDHLYVSYNDGLHPVFFTHVSLPVVTTVFPDSEKNNWYIGALRTHDEDSVALGSGK